ncbi:unnamed protein product [Lampetra fluviatilis]
MIPRHLRNPVPPPIARSRRQPPDVDGDDGGDGGDGGSSGGDDVEAEVEGRTGSRFSAEAFGDWILVPRQQHPPPPLKQLPSVQGQSGEGPRLRNRKTSAVQAGGIFGTLATEDRLPLLCLEVHGYRIDLCGVQVVRRRQPPPTQRSSLQSQSGEASRLRFNTSSGGTFHCKATDLIFEVGAAGRLRYGWREWPAELFQEQFVPISSTFDINWDGCNGGLHALMIPHYLDLKRWKHTSAIKVLHTRDGNIDVRDPQRVSQTHVRVLTSSLSIFTAVLRWLPGLVYHVHAAVLVFKVPGSLTKLQVHVVPYADANILRLKRMLQQERYEYYNIPPKSDETLVVAKRYALTCSVATNSIQPQKLTMENPPSDNNFIHVSFDGAFEEVFLTLIKRGRREKNVWTRMVQWRDKETAPQASEDVKSRRISPQSPEQLFDKIRSEYPALVGALQGNLTPLLIEFDAKKTLTPPEISQIRAVSSCNGGFEAASQLVARILEKHAGISVPVWEALWQTRDTYQKLRGLLSDVFPDRDP